MELHLGNRDIKIKHADYHNIESFSVKVPAILRVPCQWSESDCQTLVKPGEDVLRGQAVAQTEGVFVHSPVSGKVKEVTVTENCEGVSAKTVIIENDGNEKSVSLPVYHRLEDLEVDELYAHLRSAGIITTYKDGATRIKALPAPSSKIRTILLHGCSLTPDLAGGMGVSTLLQEVVSGIEVLRVLYPNAELIWQGEKGSALEEILAKFPQARIFSNHLDDLDYPVKLVIEEVLGHPLEEGCTPMMEGLLPLSFQQARAVHRAVFFGEPYMEQLVKVEGKGISNPGYYQVPLGINLGDVLLSVGVDQEQLVKVVVGCALSGTSVSRLDLPIGKSVSSIITFSKDEIFHYQNRPCIHCGRCYQVCPLRLLPQRIAAYAESNKWGLAKEEGALLCNECGRCSYICPAQRPLLQLIELAKQILAKHQMN